MTVPFVTRAEAKAVCNIRNTITEKDARIDALIMVASAQIEKETVRVFDRQTITEHFDTRSTIDLGFDDSGWSPDFRTARLRDSSFFLKGTNVDANTVEVFYDPFRGYDEGTKVAFSDFYFDSAATKLTLLIGTRQAARALRVVYTSGYEQAADQGVELEDGSHPETLSATLPPLVKEACLLQVAYLYARSRADNIGLTGDRTHGKADAMVQTLEWGTKEGLAREVLGLIRDYKRPVVGRY